MILLIVVFFIGGVNEEHVKIEKFKHMEKCQKQKEIYIYQKDVTWTDCVWVTP